MQKLEQIPLCEALAKDSAKGTTCSIKNPIDAPVIYFFNIGINHMLEHVKSSALSDIGSRSSSFSGPIAMTAAPKHS